jgi:Uma2 family endonuclease
MAIPAAHYGPWTEQDLLALPDDGQRYETVEGRLLVSPSPGSLHQRAAKRLVRLLDAAAPAHLEAVEALGIRIPGWNYLIPDILVGDTVAISADSSALDPGSVQLVIEIVSPGSMFMDKATKPLIYARAGIRHFWRVDLAEPVITVYRLRGDSPEEVVSARGGERVKVSDPFAISLDPAEILKRV